MKAKFDDLSREEILTRASDHVFSTGLDDSAHRLCCENMKFGLAKIHSVQNQSGMEPNAVFVGAPDATVTRNAHRWNNGFGYGGKLSWERGSEALIILDTLPNACGMLVGGLHELPDVQELLMRIDEITSSTEYLDDIELTWDFAVSNHFIDFYELKPSTGHTDLSFEYAFIIHGSVPELKGDNNSGFGFGMYHHKSETLRNMTETVTTPFGDVRILVDNAAREYFSFFEYAISLSRRKKRLAAELLFDDFHEICNPMHQGLLNFNEIALGCHYLQNKPQEDFFPLALRADLPAYLLEGKPNLSDDVIEYLGFHKRAERHGVIDNLRNADILPHGGGYDFPHLLRVKQVLEKKNGKRYFVTDMGTGHESEMVFAGPRELQFRYRGRQVLARTLELDMGSVAANMMPRIVLKV